MRYMIHSCDKRLWYVKEYLVPSMIAQGIPASDIEIKNDDAHRGCLWSYIDCFWRLKGEFGEGTWHMQDDVLICRDFAKKTREHNNGVVYGFYHQHKDELDLVDGERSVMDAGYSFPCMRIPDRMAAEFATWFLSDAQYREKYRRWVEERKYADAFWRDFLREKYTDSSIYCLKPSIVEHVDCLIGGSIINVWRDRWARASYFDDDDLVEDLAKKMAAHN